MKLQRNACKVSRTPISTIKREKYVILRSLVELTAHKQEDSGEKIRRVRVHVFGICKRLQKKRVR